MHLDAIDSNWILLTDAVMATYACSKNYSDRFIKYAVMATSSPCSYWYAGRREQYHVVFNIPFACLFDSRHAISFLPFPKFQPCWAGEWWETMMSPDNSPNLMLICDLDETQIIISPVWFYFIASDESQQCVLVQLNSWELGDVVFFTFYVLMGIYFSQDPLLLFFLYLLWSYCSASCAVWRVLVISLAVFILLDWKIIAESIITKSKTS
jgi:hypothetical protein